MIENTKYEEVIKSSNLDVSQASIEMTPEMFKLLFDGIYEDKEQAIVREIICNAKDSQVEKGEETPIKINVPNTLQPWWSVRDYGVGMSEKDVMQRYLRFGHSTKRESNDYVGAKGIGCKSPFSYTDSFTVTSWFDGVESQYTVHLENGIPNVTKLISLPSDEPTGLEVKLHISSADHNTFYKETFNFLKYFNYPVNVENSSEMREDLENVLLVDKGKYILHKDESIWQSSVYASMGGVCYRVSNDFIEPLRSNLLKVQKTNIILPFELGDLSVAASRETLSMDEETTKAITERVSEIKDSYKKIIKREIDVCKDLSEVFLKLRESYYLKTENNYEYRKPSEKELKTLEEEGKEIPTQYFVYPKWVQFKGKSLSLNLQEKIEEDDLNRKVRYIRKSRWDTTDHLKSLLDLTLLNFKHDRDTVHVVFNDRGQGGIKFAKEYSEKSGSIYVVLTSTQNVVDVLEKYCGFVTVISVKDNYESYFPKVKREYVKLSGLFKVETYKYGKDYDINIESKNSIPSDTKGYYLKMFRKNFKLGDREYLNTHTFCKKLIDSGFVDKDSLYLLRSSVAKKHIPEGLKEITIEELSKFLEPKLKTRYIKKIAKYGALNTVCPSTIEDILLSESLGTSLKDDKIYSINYRKNLDRLELFKNNSVLYLANRIGIKPSAKIDYYLDFYSKKYTEILNEEEDFFKDNFPLIYNDSL